uniref:Uncharacterized protein n=1 Tax=Avena sativa TaxID=4498 RepID=A0ACD5WJE4_AVESA
MDKAPVDGEKNQFSAMTREAPVEPRKEAVAIDKNQTESCAESAPPTAKHRLDDDYVSFILAMPRGLPPTKIPFSSGNNIAELLGVTEEYLEEKRRCYREAAARSERISQEFALFQEKISEEYDRLGYVEVDDEYLAGVAEMQEYSAELRKEDRDRSGFKFYDPDRCKPADDGLCSVNSVK